MIAEQLMITIKILLRVVALTTFFVIPEAKGNTRKTAELSEVGVLGTLISLYQKENGILPESWGSLLASKVTNKSVLEIKKKRGITFLRGFRFINRNKTLVMEDSTKRIIGMTTLPRRMPETNIGHRFLIVANSGGSIETLAIPEERVLLILKQQGVSLIDYTGPNADWEPEPDVPDMAQIISNINDTVLGKDGSNQPSKTLKKNVLDTTNTPQKPRSPWWFVWLLTASLLLFTVFVWWRFRTWNRDQNGTKSRFFRR